MTFRKRMSTEGPTFRKRVYRMENDGLCQTFAFFGVERVDGRFDLNSHCTLYTVHLYSVQYVGYL